MTIKQIVSDWLKANGYDGLCDDECGCTLEDFMPCDEPRQSCEPAYKQNETPAQSYDFMMGTEKPNKKGRDE